MHAHNTFEEPEKVKPVDFTFDPNSTITLPRAGIMALEIELG